MYTRSTKYIGFWVTAIVYYSQRLRFRARFVASWLHPRGDTAGVRFRGVKRAIPTRASGEHARQTGYAVQRSRNDVAKTIGDKTDPSLYSALCAVRAKETRRFFPVNYERKSNLKESRNSFVLKFRLVRRERVIISTFYRRRARIELFGRSGFPPPPFHLSRSIAKSRRLGILGFCCTNVSRTDVRHGKRQFAIGYLE